MARCASCGGDFEQPTLGRPRKNCQRCAPPKVKPAGAVQVDHECSSCGRRFTGGKLAKYCSDRCRAMGARSRPCTGCGKRMLVSRSSASEPFCLPCRRAGLAPSNAKHGPSRYRTGCRCGVCKAAVAKRMREYTARRAAEGRPVDFHPPVAKAMCEACGITFLARRGRAARFCSMACAGNGHGQRAPGKRAKIPVSLRRKILARDGGVCQLCDSPVRPDAESNHPRYPTLDHVVPFSKGGTDDESNLRLACRQCNTLRGANEDWSPSVGVAV